MTDYRWHHCGASKHRSNCFILSLLLDGLAYFASYFAMFAKWNSLSWNCTIKHESRPILDSCDLKFCIVNYFTDLSFSSDTFEQKCTRLCSSWFHFYPLSLTLSAFCPSFSFLFLPLARAVSLSLFLCDHRKLRYHLFFFISFAIYMGECIHDVIQNNVLAERRKSVD